MGMYDSLYVRCPKCKKEMELQSKSGACCLYSYNKNNLPLIVAEGLDGDIIQCQFCNSKWEFNLLNKIPTAKFKFIKSKKVRDYWANYNSNHPESIKKQKEITKWFAEDKE